MNDIDPTDTSESKKSFKDMIAKAFQYKKNFIFAIVTFLEKNTFEELEKENHILNEAISK